MRRGWMAAVLGVLLLAAAYAGYRYVDTVYLPQKRLADADAAQLALFADVRPEGTERENADAPNGTAPARPGDPDAADHAPLAAAAAVNDATVAWLTIPGTHIDYPIVQGQDNDFYLHHGFDGAYNYELGCPFLDHRCESDFHGFNSIVYGHHMTMRRMFADISLFSDADFMLDHPTGYLTLPDGVHTVTFFAYLNTYSTAPAYHAVFVTDTEKREYLEYIFSEAKHTQSLSAADIGENAHLLLLSTCTYEFNDARGILAGVIE